MWNCIARENLCYSWQTISLNGSHSADISKTRAIYIASTEAYLEPSIYKAINYFCQKAPS